MDNKNAEWAEVLGEENRVLTRARRRQGVTSGMRGREEGQGLGETMGLADLSIPCAVTNFETIPDWILEKNCVVESGFKTWTFHVHCSGRAGQCSECINLVIRYCPESDSVLVWLMILRFCDGKIFGNGIPVMVFEFKPAFGAVIPCETKSWEKHEVKCLDPGY